MHQTTVIHSTATASLRRQWLMFNLASLSAIGGGYLFLRSWWEASYSLRWLALSTGVWLYLAWALWQGLRRNHRAGETDLLPTLGAGNGMSLFRGILLAMLAGFLLVPRPEGWQAWIPGLLYTTAALADFLDGYLARVTNHATRLGEWLDINLDGIGVLAATMLAFSYGQVSWWYLPVGLARFIYLAGLWMRRRQGKPMHELPPNISRRFIAGIQMGFIFVILWPVFSPPGTHLAATIFSLPFLGGFMRDWLYITGVIRPEKETNREALRRNLAHWVPTFLRVAAIGLMGVNLMTGSRQTSLLQTMAEITVMACLAFGVAGRAAAVAGLCLIGVRQIYAPLTAAEMMAVVMLTGVLYTGTGGFSLWKPEDRLIYHKIGERPDQPAKQQPGLPAIENAQSMAAETH